MDQELIASKNAYFALWPVRMHDSMPISDLRFSYMLKLLIKKKKKMDRFLFKLLFSLNTISFIMFFLIVYSVLIDLHFTLMCYRKKKKIELC